MTTGVTSGSAAAAAATLLFPGSLRASQVAHYSAQSLSAPLPGVATLLVCPVEGPEARLLGRFERNSAEAEPGPSGVPAFRRGSGGTTLALGPGRVYVNLRLREPSALTSADEGKLLNRYVRPLLRALGKVAAPTHYFGRDWLSCAGAPVASVAFAHDARSGRSVVEAVVGFSASFAVSDASPSFLGKRPTTVVATAKSARDPRDFCELVGRAYAEAYGIAFTSAEPDAPFDDAQPLSPESPWQVTVQEAMGEVGARIDGDRVTLGGALMVSEDALRELEGRVSALPPTATLDDFGADVDAVFGVQGVALFGVRALGSLRDAAFEARARSLRAGKS